MKTPAILLTLVVALLTAPQLTAAAPDAFYLEVPGITGASSTPGHPNIIQLLSYSINGQELTAVKLTDSASPSLFLATANGTQFPTVSLLLYDTSNPNPQPENVITFFDSIFSSFQTNANPAGPPTETFTLSFAAAVPEPASLTLLAPAALLLLRRRSHTIVIHQNR